MNRLALLLAPLCLCACVPVVDPATAAGVIAQATADEQARLAAVTITVEQAQLGATAQAVDLEAQRLRAQLDADATLQAVRLSAAQTQSAGEALVLQARLAALAPTPTPTPDPQSTVRAQARADYETYGPMVLFGLIGIIVAIGLAFLFGALCNRIEGQANADKIKAKAEAEAIKTKAEAEALAKRIMARAEAQAIMDRSRADAWRQVPAGVQIISQADGGVQLLNVGGAPQALAPEPAELPTPATVKRTISARQIEPLERLAPIDQQAVRYLETCAEMVGWASPMFPPARQTGNNSDRQPVIDRLKSMRLAYSQKGGSPDKGTFVTGPYQNLKELRDAIVAGAVSLVEPT